MFGASVQPASYLDRASFRRTVCICCGSDPSTLKKGLYTVVTDPDFHFFLTSEITTSLTTALASCAGVVEIFTSSLNSATDG